MDIAMLEPRDVWKHFLTICSIPHPSHQEEALARALVGWAQGKGLSTHIDAANNVVIRKPASAGKEHAPGVILQAHLDMVPQAAAALGHDFTRDPIKPRVDPADPAWVTATGTTLGADDGIGVAMALAILEDKSLAHGPLECLFTTDEEDGMSGARAVEPGVLSGKILLNLDGEDDTELTIGCAGSIRTKAELSHAAEPAAAGLVWFELTVGGLLGGHSGVDIDKGRANATLILARVLSHSGVPCSMVSMTGGTAANAIPREARAVVGIPAGQEQAFRASIDKETTVIKKELAATDPGLAVALTPTASPAHRVLGQAGTHSLLAVLLGMPNGLLAMEPDMPGLIRTSLNLGTLSGEVKGDAFALSTMTLVRSSSDADKEDLGKRLEKSLESASGMGWSVSHKRQAESPAWSPNTASPLLRQCTEVYSALFGSAPRVSSTHGGLETGLFRPKFPDWDQISLGPTIRYPHSPDERVEIASVARSYRYVVELLRRL